MTPPTDRPIALLLELAHGRLKLSDLVAQLAQDTGFV